MQVESIAEQLFFTTIRIETTQPDGTQGSGTGFFFERHVEDKVFPFIVTNKHVVIGTQAGVLTFVQRDGSNPVLGKGIRLSLEDWSSMWVGHPAADIDIAICPLAPLEADIKSRGGVDVFRMAITDAMIPDERQIADLDALETVTFIGYPNGIWDRENLLPVARRGTTATPLSVDFERTPQFLIDASVFGGSSGSPVFLFNQGSFSPKSGTAMSIGNRLFLLGVVSAVFYRTQLNEIVAVPIPTHVKPMVAHQEMIDLGVVFKARTIMETVQAFLDSRGLA